MSQGSDMHQSVTVSNGGVTVEKAVTEEEFPVPAVVFAIRSTAADAVHVRLTDHIPEDFPMERVGFHPDYESDRWTAYKDHRVEFERTVDPGEAFRTVYGVRVENSSALRSFLTEPTVAELAPDERQEADDIEGVLGPDNSQLIRDVLAGERASLPGMDEPVAAADADEDAADDPNEGASFDAGDVDDELAPSAETAGETLADATDETPAQPPTEGPTPKVRRTDLTPAVTPRAAPGEPSPVVDTDTAQSVESIDDGDAASSPVTDRGGVAAALAAEIRDQNVSEDDLELLRNELGLGVPRSVNVRIGRLQSQVADVAAYTDALEAFLDENGTGDEVIASLRSEIDELSTAVDDEMGDVRDDIADLDGELRRLDERLSTEVETLSAELGALDEKVDDEELDDVRARVGNLEAELESVGEFRERLGDVFGAGDA
ncbi:hypothetical protein ACNS7O_12680 [Haloferacaceae archaeon DSL9]